MPEIFNVVVQLVGPNESEGQITEGFYTIEDGILTMTDAQGVPMVVNEIGVTHRMRPDDNPRAIAAVLTKKVRRAILGITEDQEKFGRTINYPRAGVA